MPLAFALLGVAVLFVVSGLKGGTIADAFAGRLTNPLDPAGPAPLDLSGATDTGNAIADQLAGTGQGLNVVGVGQFDGHPVALWIIPILKYARSRGWHGAVNSGYRTKAEQTRICATGVRPCATPGTSNHEKKVFPGGAVDVSDAAQLSQILMASPYRSVLVWAGAKDPVHFSHPHGGSY